MNKIRLIAFLGLLAFIFGFVQIKESRAGTNDNVSGFAWSENIGWISFNSTNTEAAQSYGVNINNATGLFSGYAWSENIGWISFNRADTGAPPSDDPCVDGTCIAKLNFATKQVSGWAKALTLGSNGWIHLKGTNYGVVWDPLDNEELKNWAWSDSFGWVSFSCKNDHDPDTAGVQEACSTSNYQVVAPINEPPTSAIYRWATTVPPCQEEDIIDNGGCYVPDQDGDQEKELLGINWKNVNFTRYIFDQDADGTLSGCTWMATDMAETSRIPCNNASFNALNVTVGSDQACATEGENQCVVFVRNTDNYGVASDYGISTYSADWTDPVIQNNPSFVQSESTGTFSVTASDNVELNYCWLYDATSSTSYSLDFYQNTCNQGGELSACPGGTNCKACRDMDFSPLQGHTLQVICSDQYDMETSLLTGSATYLNTASLGISSLFVTLSAVPPSGSINLEFDLSAQVAGTATGLANFKFDCTNDGSWEYIVDDIDLSSSDSGWVTRNGRKTKVRAPDTFTVRDLCLYATTGLKTAGTFVQRGASTAQDTVQIAIAQNTKPEAINLQDNSGTANYCFVFSPPIILSWEFSDPDEGDSQTAYQVQVDTDQAFSPPDIDTGKIASSSSEYAPLGLSYGTTYYWRVKVWDALDSSSQWSNGNPFATPVHAYPAPDFTWIPAFPGAQELVQFTDQTNFAAGSTSKTWSWTFGDGGSSTLQNPTHTYAQTGALGVTLQSGDDAGLCSSSQTVNVSVPFPEWQEISPF